MAFWRIKTMDSWNPLSSAFWTWNNLFGPGILTKIRADFSKKLNDSIPDVLLDPITIELPEHPVFTPYGNFYGLETLKKHWTAQISNQHETTCPYTNRPLNTALLINNPRTEMLKQLFKNMMKKQQHLLDTINHMSLKQSDQIIKSLGEFRIDLAKTAGAFEVEMEKIKKIDRLKEHLKINVNCTEHLLFWQQTNSANFIKKIGLVPSEKITNLNGEEYKIPKPIADIMRLAEKEYETEDELKISLEQFKFEMKKSKSFLKFFYKHSLSQPEKTLFSAHPIEAIDLRKQFN